MVFLSAKQRQHFLALRLDPPTLPLIQVSRHNKVSIASISQAKPTYNGSLHLESSETARIIIEFSRLTFECADLESVKTDDVLFVYRFRRMLWIVLLHQLLLQKLNAVLFHA